MELQYLIHYVTFFYFTRAINQASTEQEKAEIANKYSANAPSECESEY
jgi:hypothetical protein